MNNPLGRYFGKKSPAHTSNKWSNKYCYRQQFGRIIVNVWLVLTLRVVLHDG